MKSIIISCLVGLTYVTSALSTSSETSEDFFDTTSRASTSFASINAIDMLISSNGTSLSTSATLSSLSTSGDLTPRSCSYSDWKELTGKRPKKETSASSSGPSLLAMNFYEHNQQKQEFDDHRWALRESAEKTLNREILEREDELLLASIKYWNASIDTLSAHKSLMNSLGFNFESYIPSINLLEVMSRALNQTSILSECLSSQVSLKAIRVACTQAEKELKLLLENEYVAKMPFIICDTGLDDLSSIEEEILLIKIETCIADIKSVIADAHERISDRSVNNGRAALSTSA
jgi:hypothetical protein